MFNFILVQSNMVIRNDLIRKKFVLRNHDQMPIYLIRIRNIWR